MKDDHLFNQMRESGDAALKVLGTIYEAGFERVNLAQYNTIHVYKGFSSVSPRPDPTSVTPTSEAIILDNHEAVGIDDTLLGALRDWLTQFARWPPSGRYLYWRVLPECEWSLDFASEKVTWKVYARCAILPQEALA